MWCRWWLGWGGGGAKVCYYLAPPLLSMDVKRKCHFLGISFWVIFFEPKCHQEDVSGGPLYLSSYPLKTHMCMFYSFPIPMQAIFFGLLWGFILRAPIQVGALPNTAVKGMACECLGVVASRAQ